QDLLSRAAEGAAGEGATAHRRAHRRPALLHVVRDDLALSHAGRAGAVAPSHRRPLAAALPGEGATFADAGVRARVLLQRGDDAHIGRGPRGDLVSAIRTR